jgi:hypothetical protein
MERELKTCYNGNFLNDQAHEFWLLVSQHIHNSTPDGCLLKYREYHASDMARFVVKGRALKYKSKWSSDNNMETLIGRDIPTIFQSFRTRSALSYADTAAMQCR